MSALPAIAVITESLVPATPVRVYLGAARHTDRDLLPARDGMTVQVVDDVAVAVAEDAPQAGRVQAWVAAEAGVARRVRRHLLEHWGVDRDDPHASAYWKAGHDQAQFDAIHLARYQQAVAEGKDVVDPDVREALELQPCGMIRA